MLVFKDSPVSVMSELKEFFILRKQYRKRYSPVSVIIGFKYKNEIGNMMAIDSQEKAFSDILKGVVSKQFSKG